MTPTLQQLYDRCDDVGECLLWRGPISNHSPQFYVGGFPGSGTNKKGAYRSVRRLVYECCSGHKIKAGLHPVTACRERACVRFEHLKLLTTKQIAQLASKEGRFSTPQRAIAIREGIRKSGRAKLTPEQVREIRTSTETGKALAARFGVDRSLPPRIRRGEAWQELAPNASVFNMRA